MVYAFLLRWSLIAPSLHPTTQTPHPTHSDGFSRHVFFFLSTVIASNIQRSSQLPQNVQSLRFVCGKKLEGANGCRVHPADPALGLGAATPTNKDTLNNYNFPPYLSLSAQVPSQSYRQGNPWPAAWSLFSPNQILQRTGRPYRA